MHAPQTQLAPRRTIQFWLNCLVIACVVPAVIVTTFIIFSSFTRERVGFERDLVGTARALSQAVDAELNGDRSALLVLAISPHLASGDLTGFYGEAQQLVHALNIDNIVLSDMNGQQLINTLRPFGASLPIHGDREQLRRVIETGQPVISDLFIGALTKQAYHQYRSAGAIRRKAALRACVWYFSRTVKPDPAAAENAVRVGSSNSR